MQYLELNNGVKMPFVGYGTFQIEPKDTQQCVENAISVGYRLIDTAQAYANEEGVVQLAHKGDTVLCPPDLKHFHGVTDKQSGAHTALTGVQDGQNVVWLDKVSDKEYAQALKKAK